jgi:hypothetical protein
MVAVEEVVLSASSCESAVQAWCARADTSQQRAAHPRGSRSCGPLRRAQGPRHLHAAGVVQGERVAARLRVPHGLLALPGRCVGGGGCPHARRPAALSAAARRAAQTSKGALLGWTWGREQPVLRCFVAEPLCTLAASPDGALAAGGTASGTVQLWATASGKLLRTWAAHHKAVAALAFAPDGSWLVSGGEDTAVCVWSLAGAARAPPHALRGALRGRAAW